MPEIFTFGVRERRRLWGLIKYEEREKSMCVAERGVETNNKELHVLLRSLFS